jgi:hypothetical protein
MCKDMLQGSGAIAEHVYGRDNAVTRKKILRHIENDNLPYGRLGNKFVASKRAVDRWWANLTHVSEAAE